MTAVCLLPSGVVDRGTRWIQIIKSLPFEGGPSAAKWVYLAVAAVGSLCLLMLSVVAAWVYWRTGHVDGAMSGLLLGILIPLFGFASNTKNQQQTLNAQLSAGTTPTMSASTPVSAESSAKDPNG